MKQIIPHVPNITAAAFVQLAVVVVFVSAFLLTGCSENELPSNENTDTNRTTFTIEVSDGGYAPAAGEKPDTRATENDYTTQFTAGDKIGVFAVKNNEIVDGVNNLCLVATADGSNLVWKTEDGKTPLNISDATYYAYYPWQPDEKITDKVYPATDKVTTFFYDVIKDWIPSTNQGTYIDYTSSDLMIASGTPADKSLSFSMQHKMALVVIDLPKTKYKLTDANGQALPDYIIDAPDTKFKGFTPYRMSDGTYRYLIKPAATNSQPETLSGSYTNATSATAEWEFKASVTAGQYGKYVVDDGTIIEETHQLQAGDFFMKDGTLLGKDEETLTPAQQAACIGIVYWVGDITKEDPLLKRDKPSCTHGLVVSLWDMPDPDDLNSVRMTWTYGGHEYVNAWLGNATWTGDNSRPKDFSSIQVTDKMQGYANTIALKEYNKYVEGKEDDGYGPEGNKRVKPVKGLDAFETTHRFPSSSSGWYWPSVKELKYVCWGQGNEDGATGKKMLDTQIKKVSGSNPFDEGPINLFWSSTEYSGDSGNAAWSVKFNNLGSLSNTGRKGNSSYRVRPLLAF